MSSTKAEYTPTTEAACEGVWLRKLFNDLGRKQGGPTTIYCDNMSTISLTKNPVFHARSKHIELRHHFIPDLVQQEEIQLEFISTNEQPADMLKKPITTEKFLKFRNMLGLTVLEGNL